MAADRSWVLQLRKALKDLESSDDPMLLVNIGRWLGKLEACDFDLSKEYAELRRILEAL